MFHCMPTSAPHWTAILRPSTPRRPVAERRCSAAAAMAMGARARDLGLLSPTRTEVRVEFTGPATAQTHPPLNKKVCALIYQQMINEAPGVFCHERAEFRVEPKEIGCPSECGLSGLGNHVGAQVLRQVKNTKAQ